jgi:hypothetical protein
MECALLEALSRSLSSAANSIATTLISGRDAHTSFHQSVQGTESIFFALVKTNLRY